MADEEEPDLPPGVRLPATLVPAAPPPSRCWPDVDACRTRGDCRGNAWICLHWAHGACAKGAECESLHRLPILADEQRLIYSADGLSLDVFGRRRDAVAISAGSASDNPFQCTTIYISSGLPTAATQRECKAQLQGLAEWGELVCTWVGAVPGSGYVKYRWRSSAQFAMEALAGRPFSPEGGPALQMRWEFGDPDAALASQAQAVAMRTSEEAKRRRDEQHELYARLERESYHVSKQPRSATATYSASAVNPARPLAASELPPLDEAEARAAEWVEKAPMPLTAVTAEYPTDEADRDAAPAA